MVKSAWNHACELDHPKQSVHSPDPAISKNKGSDDKIKRVFFNFSFFFPTKISFVAVAVHTYTGSPINKYPSRQETRRAINSHLDNFHIYSTQPTVVLLR